MITSSGKNVRATLRGRMSSISFVPTHLFVSQESHVFFGGRGSGHYFLGGQCGGTGGGWQKFFGGHSGGFLSPHLFDILKDFICSSALRNFSAFDTLILNILIISERGISSDV